MPSWKQLLIVTAAYGVLGCVYTYPLVLRISTHIPDLSEIVDEFQDPALASWLPWWAQTALLHSDRDLLHCDWVYYPHGMEMTMQPAMILHGIMTIPFTGLDFTTANNIVILISFALSGLSAFLLGYYVLRNWPGALLCGFVYSFCP